MSETFGQWLAARRNERGFTLRDVETGTRGGVSNALLSQIENGRVQHPSAVVCHRLAAFYGIDFAEMLTRAGDPNPPEQPHYCPTCGQRARP